MQQCSHINFLDITNTTWFCRFPWLPITYAHRIDAFIFAQQGVAVFVSV